ncbi:MAG: RNA methyltransferase [Clostridia bacterium]|nr:RNA methyltransferase [Clostridia bacterium]
MRRESDRIAAGTLFEGMTSVRAVLAAMEAGLSDRRILRLYVAEERRQKRAKELGWLACEAETFGFPIVYLPAEQLDEMTTGSTHGGVAAECSDRTIPPLDGADLPDDGFLVMLEGIEDPYNFGYALRSLYACGADAVILSPRNWMSAAGVVCRSSAGASERLPLFVADPAESARTCKARGYRVLAAGIRDSVSSFDCDMQRPLFLIVGGEKRGISAAALAEADKIVRIDYGRAFGGSLSAASAAAMLGYEVLRQNRERTR